MEDFLPCPLNPFVRQRVKVSVTGQIQCPRCRQVLVIRDLSPGSKVRCPKCSTTLSIKKPEPHAMPDLPFETPLQGPGSPNTAATPRFHTVRNPQRKRTVVAKRRIWIGFALFFLVLSAAVVSVYAVPHMRKFISDRGHDETSRRDILAMILSASRCDVTCVEVAMDARSTAISEKIANWSRKNPTVFKNLILQNTGKPLPFQSDMGISEEEYNWFIENFRDSVRLNEVGPALSYTIKRDGNLIGFSLVEEGDQRNGLIPRTTPFAVDQLLTLTRIDETTTQLTMINVDVGEAESVDGESKLLGEFHGFRWHLEDQRLLNYVQIPAGEVAANVTVQLLFSSKHQKIYGNFEVVTGDNAGIHVNTDVDFFMDVNN